MTVDLSHIAQALWERECVGVTADQLDARVVCRRSVGESETWLCRGHHPINVVDTLPRDGRWDSLTVITGGTARSHPSEPGVRVRTVISVDHNGGCVALQAVDGVDDPDVMRDTFGPMYAAMVSALVPVGELEATLADILATGGK